MTNTRPEMERGLRTFRALICLIPAAYGLWAIYGGFYDGIEYIPLHPYVSFGLKLASAAAFFYWGGVVWKYCRVERIVNYRRVFEMYPSSLTPIGKRPAPFPGILELGGLLMNGVGIIAAAHLFRFENPSLYFWLLPLGVTAYCVVSVVALHIWRVKEQKNVAI